MREYAALLNGEGYHALVLDSLTARGEKELCTQKHGSRRVTQAHRRLDALAAISWLSQRAEVDATRIALLGWSHGGSAVLAATNASHEAVQMSAIKPRAAVAFYPGCRDELKRGYAASAPLLVMTGAMDDWTPPGPCRDLAEHARSAGASASVELVEMPEAYHGFDNKSPVRLRSDVPNGVHAGKGVHVGGNEAARAQSQQLLKDFLKRILSIG